MKRPRSVIYVPQVLSRIYAKKGAFLILFLVIFFVSFTALAALGIAPGSLAFRQPSAPIALPANPNSAAVAKGEGELPVRIEIPAVGIKATVSNPDTTDIDALDQQLLAGAVRYPGTGVLGEDGTVLLFGHSSHLPVVHNQAYKTFNDIQNLKQGDPIYVYGANKTYTYAVESVQEENTTTGAIPIDQDGAHLTLATCDNFGTKADRFVVTAELVSVADVGDNPGESPN